MPLDSSSFRVLLWAGLISLGSEGVVVVFPWAANAAEAREPTNRTKGSLPLNEMMEMSLGVGAGLLFPLARPALSLSLSALSKTWTTSIRATGSYTQLSSSFESAAKDSEYSDKIKTTDASLWDVELAVPELSIALPLSTFVAAAPTLRTSRCVSHFTTISGEPLVFSGWALAAGGSAKAGYRHTLMTENLTIELFGGMNWPLWSYGSTSLVYVRQGTAGSETFSDPDLVSMLDSLQPYMQNLSNLPTAQVGVSAAWRF